MRKQIKNKLREVDKFEIDFFELSFLIEACIPPRPIARTMFFQKASSHYYHMLSDAQRNKLFTWLQLNPSFDTKNEYCKHFYDRFNPDNQYKIDTFSSEMKESILCYKHKGQYHTKENTFVSEEYITKVTKVNNKILNNT